MAKITTTDLSAAVAQAVALSHLLGQSPVIVGALALAAHGYRRETSDVDIAIPVIMAESGHAVEAAARTLGLTVRARHAFGGLDLRADKARIDVITLDRDLPGLVPNAVEEAIASDRRIELFGETVFVVSIGHLIAMKLVAERKKDAADIVELIKARCIEGEWDNDRAQVYATVQQHLGWYAARVVRGLAQTAQRELGDEG